MKTVKMAIHHTALVEIKPYISLHAFVVMSHLFRLLLDLTYKKKKKKKWRGRCPENSRSASVKLTTASPSSTSIHVSLICIPLPRPFIINLQLNGEERQRMRRTKDGGGEFSMYGASFSSRIILYATLLLLFFISLWSYTSALWLLFSWLQPIKY